MNLVHVYLEGSLRILEVDPFAFRLPDKSKEVARLLFCFQHAEKDSLSVKLARLSLVNSEDSEKKILDWSYFLNWNFVVLAEPLIIFFDIRAEVGQQLVAILQKLAVLFYFVVKLLEVVQIWPRNLLRLVYSKELDGSLVVSRLLVGVRQIQKFDDGNGEVLDFGFALLLDLVKLRQLQQLVVFVLVQ